MLDKLREYLNNTTFESPEVGQTPNQAAVLIALTDNRENPSVVLTKRADTLSSHSGEVSFPGGKWEEQDPSLEFTALRETHEEIGVAPEQVEVLGGLQTYQTFRGLHVSPYVGVIPEGLIYKPNPAELDEIFHVPVSFFLDDKRLRTDTFDRKIGHRWSPAYGYDGFEIWGFTARVLTNFLWKALEADIEEDHPAPVKHWRTD